RCRAAAEEKYSAWIQYKRNPTQHNKSQHRAACRRMVATCKWAMNRSEEDLKKKLRGPGVGNKTWWSLVKEKQGTSCQDVIPPLTRQDGTVATSSKEKASCSPPSSQKDEGWKTHIYPHLVSTSSVRRSSLR
ncbi:hypothetical protein Pmani_014268, partial [Petrolisthes manimaculis]